MGSSEIKAVLLAAMFLLVYVPVSIPAGRIIGRKGFHFAVTPGAFLASAFSFPRLFADNCVPVLLGMMGISAGQPFVLNGVAGMVNTRFPADGSAPANVPGLSPFSRT